MSTVAHGIVLRDARTFSLEIDFLGGEIIIGYSDSVGGLLQFRSGVGGTQEEALGGGGHQQHHRTICDCKIGK